LAVTVWLPTVSVLLLNVAVVTPLVVLTLAGLPVLLPSTWNCTVPVGVPAPGAVILMVAVKVTLWPKPDGLAEAATAVLLLALVTVWVSAAEVLALKVVSPL
jgi:hypothetical protein